MKKINIVIAFTATLFLLFSCEEEAEKVVISENPVAPELVGPDDLSFTMEDADNPVVFTWTQSDFGFQASITYGIQLGMDASFSQAATLMTTQALEGSQIVSDINNVLSSWNMEIGTPATVYARAFAVVSPDVDTVFSPVKEYTVVPYETLIDYPMIYVPGEYQGWSPGAENGRLYSYEFNSVYEGIIRLTDEDESGMVEFKLAPEANWDNSWGGTITDGSGTLDPSGGNYMIEPGTYKIVADVSALTVTLTATDDWGIIGSSVPPYDWSEDIDMFYNGQRKMWEITEDFVTGEFKFRANDDWALNYGSDNADGNLNAGGANIPLGEDGNYTIRMDTEALKYEVIKN